MSNDKTTLQNIRENLIELRDALGKFNWIEFGSEPIFAMDVRRQLEGLLEKLRSDFDGEYTLVIKPLRIANAYFGLRDSLAQAVEGAVGVEAQGRGSILKTRKMVNLIENCLEDLTTFEEIERKEQDTVSSEQKKILDSPHPKFHLSIVRIYKKSFPVGAGMLIPDNSVLTSAHVVSNIFGQTISQVPEGEICLDFPFIENREILSAHVSFWGPTQPEHPDDVACLRIHTDLPVQVSGMVLIDAEQFWDHRLRAFGFPEGHEDGIWVSGLIRERQAGNLLQIEDTNQIGYFVQPGFSGTPVWDEKLEGVVGIVTAADRQASRRTGFAIPTDKLVKVCPPLSKHIVTK